MRRELVVATVLALLAPSRVSLAGDLPASDQTGANPPASGAAATSTGPATAAAAGPTSERCTIDAFPARAALDKCITEAKAAHTAATAAREAADTARIRATTARDTAQKALADAKDDAKPGLQVKLDEAQAALTDAETEHGKAVAAEEAAKKELERMEAMRSALDTVTNRAAFAKAHNCADPRVLCFDAKGAEFVKHELPREVNAGEVYVAKVIMTKGQMKNEVTRVAFSNRAARDVTFEISGDQPRTADAQDLLAAAATSDEALVLYKTFTAEAVGDEALEFVVTVTHAVKDPNAADAEPVIDDTRSYVIPVARGYSYYSVALLVAATYRGERTIHRDLSASENTSLEGGLALNIFPGGRRRGVIGYLRATKGWARAFADTLGVQLGTDLNLSDPFDHVYAGIVFEPVAGLGFVAGMSLRTVAFVPPGSDLPGQLDPTDSIPTVDRRVLRPYLGVTVTFDLLDTLARVGSDIRKVKAP